MGRAPVVARRLRLARLLTAGAALVLLSASCSPADSEPPSSSQTSASADLSPTPVNHPAVTDLTAAGATELDVAGDFLTVTDDAVFLAGKTDKRVPVLYRLARTRSSRRCNSRPPTSWTASQ